MLDSLLGIVILLLLTSWMVSTVSIQSRLLSSSSRLTSREQVDYLRAAKSRHVATPADYASSSFAPVDPCGSSARAGRFLEHIKTLQPSTLEVNHLDDLRRLLIAPQLMVRADGVTPSALTKSLQEEGQLPFTSSNGKLDINNFMPASEPNEPGNFNLPSSAQPDWAITQADKSLLPLRICPPTTAPQA